jgi:hypothetical protein
MPSLLPGTYLVVTDCPFLFPLQQSCTEEFDSQGASGDHIFHGNIFELILNADEIEYPVHTVVWEEFCAVAIGPIPNHSTEVEKQLRVHTNCAGIPTSFSSYQTIRTYHYS